MHLLPAADLCVLETGADEVQLLKICEKIALYHFMKKRVFESMENASDKSRKNLVVNCSCIRGTRVRSCHPFCSDQWLRGGRDCCSVDFILKIGYKRLVAFLYGLFIFLTVYTISIWAVGMHTFFLLPEANITAIVALPLAKIPNVQ